MDNARETSDLISHLPGDVTENILLRLPLKEAVKTSLLSKRWRCKWITIPQLVFDSSTFSSSSKRNLLTRSEFLLIIHQVLLQHEGPISKFTLSLGSCPEIDHLISFLSRKSIEEFTLYIAEEYSTFVNNRHKIPLYLFPCLQMRLLCLHECVFKPPPHFAGFAKLTNVNFSGVDLPTRFAETFVAKCPLLECLTLHKCTNLDRISFYAPNLKLLDYQGRVGSISFKNTPGLEKISLCHDGPLLRNTWVETLWSLPSLEYLHLGRLFYRHLGVGAVPNRLARSMNRLVILVLSGLHLGCVEPARCALCLIKSSPNLQGLKIELSGCYIDDPATQFSEVTDSSEFSLEKLHDVQMSYFGGSVSDMEFIELLLAKSPVLETMLIYHHRGSTADQKYSVVQNTNQFQRASPRARVIFLEQDGS